MKSDLSVKMLSYNQVRDMASISYINTRGKVKSVYIHRDTFSKLMSGDLDKKPETDGPTMDQRELKDVLIKEVKKDYDKWFDHSANTLAKADCHGRAELQA